MITGMNRKMPLTHRSWSTVRLRVALVLATITIALGGHVVADDAEACPLRVSLNRGSCAGLYDCGTVISFDGIPEDRPLFVPRPFQIGMTWVPAAAVQEVAGRRLEPGELGYERERGFAKFEVMFTQSLGLSTDTFTVIDTQSTGPNGLPLGEKPDKGVMEAGDYRLRLVYTLDDSVDNPVLCIVVSPAVRFDKEIRWMEE